MNYKISGLKVSSIDSKNVFFFILTRISEFLMLNLNSD